MHMGESSLRREPGIEPHGAPRLAVRTAVGPTCGGERPTLQPRAAAEVRFATSSGEGLLWLDETHPPRHSAWQKDLMCAGLLPTLQ